MSETPKRKRLSDEGALMFWEAPTSSDLRALKRDHLQAREDRKRLADALRVVADTAELAPGHRGELLALLAEVDS